MALLFLLEPGVRRVQVAQVRNRVAVLVDRSASMSFPAEAGVSREAAVGRYLTAVKAQLEKLQERFSVELLGFGPDLTPVSPERLLTEWPRGSATDLLGALRTLKATDASGAKKLSGVLLFSDGADNAELSSGAVGKARSELNDLGIPVSTFAVGSEGLVDLSVEAVKVDDFAFVRNSITVEVEVRARGFAGQPQSLRLEREGQVVGTKTFTPRSNDDTQRLSFSFTPDQTGRFVYTVSMPVQPEEVVKDNNSRSFVLKVIRDRVRVLLVVGRPSWDERFLRGLLEDNANVDLVSFYILRTTADETRVANPERELSLIPFPMEEIFNTKLSTFDVVIFQNFGYTDPQLDIHNYEQGLEQYVYGGGALVVVGGDHAFGEAGSDFPILGKALPVEPSGQGVKLGSFRPRLTAQGARHPVTLVGPTAAASEAMWAALPPLNGLNLVRPREGATVLMDHPFENVEGKSAPVLALWDYGRGRSMALMVDDTWLWAFSSHRQGPPNRAYERLWGNALRWLVRDPDLTTLQVTAEPPTVEPGNPVGVAVTARKASYEPAAGAQVTVELYSVEAQKVVARQTASAAPDGTVHLSFPPVAAGAYKLLGTASLGGQELGRGEDALAVRAVGPELSDASARPALLEQIAGLTGGKAYRLPRDGLPEVPLLEPPVVEVGRSKDQPLWDRWYFLSLFVALLGAEWFFRRRFGYV
jgi:uncharacterized membrane protein